MSFGCVVGRLAGWLSLSCWQDCDSQYVRRSLDKLGLGNYTPIWLSVAQASTELQSELLPAQSPGLGFQVIIIR